MNMKRHTQIPITRIQLMTPAVTWLTRNTAEPETVRRVPLPRPEEDVWKTAIRRHWDRKADTFDEGESRISRDPRILEAWRTVFRELFGPEPLTILDVGSGTGELGLLFAELGHEVTGVDLSPAMVARARAKAAARGLNCRFQVGDAEKPAFPEWRFDVVHARHLLWTLPRPREALRAWIRVLRPGGRLLVTESVWDGAPRSPIERLQRRAGRWVASWAARLQGRTPPGPKHGPDYPGPEALPFYGGLGRERLVQVLEAADLIRVQSRNLLWLRRLGRTTVPWYRRWMSPRKQEYYLAWGTRP